MCGTVFEAGGLVIFVLFLAFWFGSCTFWLGAELVLLIDLWFGGWTLGLVNLAWDLAIWVGAWPLALGPALSGGLAGGVGGWKRGLGGFPKNDPRTLSKK